MIYSVFIADKSIGRHTATRLHSILVVNEI